MNKLENIDNINIDDLYNKIVDRIEKAKRNDNIILEYRKRYN